MVAVSITFVILSSPITIYYAIGPYLYGDDFAHNFDNPFYLIGDCIQYTNSGINFYLYVCFTNSFREELVNITNEMKCRRRTEESVRETSSVARQSSVLQTFRLHGTELRLRCTLVACCGVKISFEYIVKLH